MNKKCLYEKLNDQKGAAAIITLSVILVLTALGTIALVVSTMSVRMSGKTVTWSDEYYSMDSMAEKYIHQIDAVIADAEKDARKYVQHRLDRINPTSPNALEVYMESKSLSFEDNYDYDMNISTNKLINDDVQEFFYKYYEYDWVSGGSELTLDDYQMHKLDGDLDTISKSFANDNLLTTESAFKLDLNNYMSQLFDRVYYHMLSVRLLDYTEGNDTLTGPGVPMYTTQNVVLKGGSATYGNKESNEEYRCTYRYTNISYSNESSMVADWDTNKNPSEDGNNIGLYIRIQGGTVQDPKQVRVDVDVTLPDFQTVTKYVHTPIYGNPLLTNALSAYGSVTFEDGTDADPTNVKIIGDVYSSSESGISINENANINIRGNVYTPGDLKVIGDKGRLTVDTAATATDPTPVISYDFKEKVYGSVDIDQINNKYLYDNKVNKKADNIEDFNINPYTPSGASGHIPMIFEDSKDQGNVYCDSVFIGNDDVEGAEINIKGNLWTKDDIQLDANDSRILIGTPKASVDDAGNTIVIARYNYIGLSQESAPGVSLDAHLKSSSVINNYPYTSSNWPNSEIVMNSNFIVPGVAFYDFTSNGKIYMSSESVTSRTTNPMSIINAYLHDPDNVVDHLEYSDDFDLITDSYQKKKRLIEFVDDINILKTNIRTDLTGSQIGGYVAGVALLDSDGYDAVYGDQYVEMYTHLPFLNPGDQGSAAELKNSFNNYEAHTRLYNNNVFAKIFYSKTRKLGTVGNGLDSTAAVPFSDFIDSSISDPSTYFNDYEIKVITDGKLNVNAVSEGIVYCDGDLTITSEVNGLDTITDDAVFRGTVICTGNVTIKDDVKLVYDEFVILEKLKNYFDVREFFENISATYFSMNKIDEIDIATTSGQRNVVKRLKIKSWRELPVSP